MANKNYVESTELRTIAENLQERYFLHLGHIDLDSIFFAEITNDKGKKAPVGEVSGITSAWVRQKMQEMKENRLYCLAVYAAEWMQLDPPAREWLVFDLLLCVDPHADGKVRKRDINEHGVFLEYFASVGIGPYWRNLEQPLPSLLEGDNPLPIPIPPDEEEESAGSTLDDEE